MLEGSADLGLRIAEILAACEASYPLGLAKKRNAESDSDYSGAKEWTVVSSAASGDYAFGAGEHYAEVQDGSVNWYLAQASLNWPPCVVEIGMSKWCVEQSEVRVKEGGTAVPIVFVSKMVGAEIAEDPEPVVIGSTANEVLPEDK